MYALTLALFGVAAAWFPELEPWNSQQVCTDIDWFSQIDDVMTHRDQPPFQIDTDVSSYLPGRPIKVSVKSNQAFRGILLQCLDESRHGLGTFTPPNLLKNMTSFATCRYSNDTLLVWLDVPKASVDVTWLLSAKSNYVVGPINFRAAVFTDERNVWPNVLSSQLYKAFSPIDVSGCGTSKGCFRYSSGKQHCDAESCYYLFTYSVEDYTNVTVELSGKSDWVGVGFSSDREMMADDVMVCRRQGTSADPLIEHYWTQRAHSPPEKIKDYSFRHESSYENGIIRCRYSRPLKVTNDGKRNLDLNTDWYQMYVWGPLSAAGSMRRHTLSRPPTSQTKISVLEYIDVIDASSSLHQQAPVLQLIVFVTFLLLFRQS